MRINGRSKTDFHRAKLIKLTGHFDRRPIPAVSLSPAWKAEVTPLVKQDDHEQATNNRPISLLPVLFKVCESESLIISLPLT